ncbi:MAG: Xaa-Pro aminopeptidase [Gemmatimonadaceae bacterium]|nr:Xaa-Pro aminopeptidase [Gemmatimonadaceae bacterium]
MSCRLLTATLRTATLRTWIPLAICLGAILVPAPQAHSQIPETEYAQRRTAVAEQMRDGFMVVEGAPEPEHDYEDFVQDPNFLYLTGLNEQAAALVLVKHGAVVTQTLFVAPRNPAREVWSGFVLGVEGAAERTGLATRDHSDVEHVVDSLAAALPLVYLAGGRGEIFMRLRNRESPRMANADDLIARLRGRKSEAELDLIRKAIAITVDAQRLAMRSISPGMNEFEIEGLIEYTFRRNGADRPAFASIVGSGPNSTTLHYNRNDRFMNAGELVVMDVGASYRGYAGDVTRTVPVSGVFSPEQRAIYQLVRDAQAAGERAARPGSNSMALNLAVDSVIKHGLAALGLIESANAVYDCGINQRATTCPQYRLYYMHGLGHGIGLEVHDPGTSGIQPGILSPGDAFSIEPGVYVRANLLDIIPPSPRNDAMKARIASAVWHYANIGVRIEDDYLVTDSGVEWASGAPREIAEIEAVMRERVSGPRDPAKIDWYRATEHPGLSPR